jgi:serine phosphatase RsbU (regulator of sigma subunit)/anti-sigma regulatory factor (Ser/Thr protein kinase)
MAHPGAPVSRGEPQPVRAPAVLVLRDEPTETSRARRWAADQLLAAGLDELRDDVVMVVGELVANALLHAGLPAEVVLYVAPPRVRVEVRDRSRLSPVRARHGAESMTGRGLRLVEAVARAWGVDRREDGKGVWAEFEDGSPATGPEPFRHDIEALLETWAPDDESSVLAAGAEERFTVRLGDVPTELLLAAKAHVDDLVLEFTLAAAGARTGVTAEVPRHLAELLEAVVDRFAEPRQMIKRQALAAANAGEDHVALELTLPAAAADAAEEYLQALDEADAYCRAARLLTLETPPRQRVFRRWYVKELVDQLRRATAGRPPVEPQTFEQRLLVEIDALAEAGRTAERSARLNALVVALAGAVTPEQVAAHALNEGVAAMGASGGGLLLTTGRSTLEVPGTVGYDASVVAGLRAESPDADLPAAHAARTGQPVWLESRRERDEQFPALAGLEPHTIAMCAVPLVVGEKSLGALRFSFSTARLFDGDERAFALNLAAQTSQALDRALLHHQQAETARTLQRNLLPPELPAVPGVDLASHYDPAEAVEVGGDFYDLIGADSEWTVLMGDVRGKGVEAAALTAMARHTVRSGALSGLDPGETLELLNVAFLSMQSPENFCTAVCGRLSLRDGYATLTVACGGHPEPLIVRTDGTVEPITCNGMLVGAFPGTSYVTATTVLHPGDLVLFYTDGITEARRDDEFFGLQRMQQQLAATVGATAETVIRQLHTAVEAFRTRQRDDMAMLTLRLL